MGFELVLYYKKKVVIGGVPSIEEMIAEKAKVSNISSSDIDMDKILDEYSEYKRKNIKTEIVDTWVMIDEDSENFIDEINKVQNDNNFVNWEDNSLDTIKRKMI